MIRAMSDHFSFEIEEEFAPTARRTLLDFYRSREAGDDGIHRVFPHTLSNDIFDGCIKFSYPAPGTDHPIRLSLDSERFRDNLAKTAFDRSF